MQYDIHIMCRLVGRPARNRRNHDEGPRAEAGGPVETARASATGFPSPADDYVDRPIDLNKVLVAHPAATFFLRVEGVGMEEEGIAAGDVLVVDRSLTPRDGDVVVAVCDGELVVRRMRLRRGRAVLTGAGGAWERFALWGVATYTIRRLRHP